MARKIHNTQEWGRKAADARHGGTGKADMKPADLSDYLPQAPEDKQYPGYANDVSISSWLRNGNATTMPHFDKGNAWRGGKLRDK